jgi:hypothetical protein
MAVYVDELRVYPNAWGPFKAGSCHMTADSLDELHELAGRIGLKRSWFQDKSVPHYDLTKSKREAALAAGAVSVDAREQARRRIAARAASKPSQ